MITATQAKVLRAVLDGKATPGSFRWNTWKSLEYNGLLVWPRIGGVVVTPAGRAALAAYEEASHDPAG